jgi:hypothetical protein
MAVLRLYLIPGDFKPFLWPESIDPRTSAGDPFGLQNEMRRTSRTLSFAASAIVLAPFDETGDTVPSSE